MRKRLFFLLSMILLSHFSFAQGFIARGKITDQQGGPLQGVAVRLKGSTTTGAVSAQDGSFSLNVPAKTSILTFSGLNYEPAEMTASANMNIALRGQSGSLEDVVVVGYEVKRKKDVAASITSMRAEELENRPVLSPDKAMQGKMSGVQVINNNGIPGGSATVRIRGIGSIQAGTQPLYIIDGIQVNSGDQTRNFPSSNALAQLNPDDIESIDVLKDPAAASIYGAQAANGVVVITTKRGKFGGKTSVTVNTSYGVSQKLKSIPVLTGPEAVQLGYEAYLNRNGKPAADAWLTANFKGSKDSAQTFNWQDFVFRNGIYKNADVAVTGGTEKTKFYMSAAYNQTDGIVKYTDFKRGTFKLSVDHKLSSKLQVSTGINLASYKQNGVQPNSDFANPYRGGILIWPTNTPYNPDGSYNLNFFGSYNINPIRMAEQNIYNAKTNKMLGNIALTYLITPSLTFRSSWNMEYTDIDEEQFLDPRNEYGVTNRGEYYTFGTKVFDWQTDQTLNWSKKIGNSNFSALAGVQYRSNVNKTRDVAAKGFPGYQFLTLGSAASIVSFGGNNTAWKLAGAFAKLSYTYDNRYILNATIRRDGSSRFGSATQYGNFPSVAAAWRVNNESFMKTADWINDMKLRLSYGITGNNIISATNNFAARGLIGNSGEYLGNSGLSVTQFPSADLSWEENRSTNFGLDLGLWKNKVIATVDYFISNREQLLLAKPLPGTNGLTSIRENVGTLQNKGIEAELTLRLIENDNWTLSVNGNFTYTKNKITKLLDNQSRLDVATVVGMPLNQIFTYNYLGANPANGLPMWRDTLGNPTYLTQTRDRVYIGQIDPKFFGGFGAEVGYKNLSLSFLFQYSGGNLVLNQDAIFGSRSGSTVDRNQYATQMRRWTTPGQITDVPKPYLNGSVPGLTSSFYALSDRWYESGDYLRLKDVTINYTLPKKLLSRLGMSAGRIYLNGTNLLTFTKYEGYDVEFVNVNGDFGNYPQSRQILAGLQVTF